MFLITTTSCSDPNADWQNCDYCVIPVSVELLDNIIEGINRVGHLAGHEKTFDNVGPLWSVEVGFDIASWYTSATEADEWIENVHKLWSDIPESPCKMLVENLGFILPPENAKLQTATLTDSSFTAECSPKHTGLYVQSRPMSKDELSQILGILKHRSNSPG